LIKYTYYIFFIYYDKWLFIGASFSFIQLYFSNVIIIYEQKILKYTFIYAIIFINNNIKKFYCIFFISSTFYTFSNSSIIVTFNKISIFKDFRFNENHEQSFLSELKLVFNNEGNKQNELYNQFC
jgi:hypothetical protein